MNALPALCAQSVNVVNESGIAEAARAARSMAAAVGFGKVQVCSIATAASELAANLYFHARGGLFEVRPVAQPCGLELVTTDCGPGIADVARALQDGYSTTGSLGCGLPGVSRLMDKLEIDSALDHGTCVRAWKWL